jgi:HEAT repeat protein
MLPMLEKVLDGADADLRRGVAEALGHVGGPRSLDVLRRLVARERNQELRRFLAACLLWQHPGDPQAVQVLDDVAGAPVHVKWLTQEEIAAGPPLPPAAVAVERIRGPAREKPGAAMPVPLEF